MKQILSFMLATSVLLTFTASVAMDQSSVAFDKNDNWFALVDSRDRYNVLFGITKYPITFADLQGKELVVYSDALVPHEETHKLILLEKKDGTYRQIGCGRFHKRYLNLPHHDTSMTLRFTQPEVTITATHKMIGSLALAKVDTWELEWSDRPMTKKEVMVTIPPYTTILLFGLFLNYIKWYQLL
jgi:hypothetical protein